MGSAAYAFRDVGNSFTFFQTAIPGVGGGHLNVASACQLRGSVLLEIENNHCMYDSNITILIGDDGE